MAEGLLRHDLGEKFDVFSAGVAPTDVRPEAIDAMSEVGIDISGQRSKSVAEFTGQQFDYVITVCDNANQEFRYFRARPNASIGASKTLRPLRVTRRLSWRRSELRGVTYASG